MNGRWAPRLINFRPLLSNYSSGKFGVLRPWALIIHDRWKRKRFPYVDLGVSRNTQDSKKALRSVRCLKESPSRTRIASNIRLRQSLLYNTCKRSLTRESSDSTGSKSDSTWKYRFHLEALDLLDFESARKHCFRNTREGFESTSRVLVPLIIAHQLPRFSIHAILDRSIAAPLRK